MATLVLLKAGETKPYPLVTDETVLGRLPECTIQVDSNMVSRKHARLIREGTRFYVEDLGSGNGTAVNGQRIAARTLLNHDDRVKLGPILFRFEDPLVGSKTEPEGFRPSPKMPGFAVEMDGDEDTEATIMGTAGLVGGFGSLDVQPEAKLKGVLEISRGLAGTVDLDAMLPKILDTLFKVFPAADRGCILLKDEQGKMVPRAMKHRRAGDDESVKISRTILKKVLEDKQGVLSADAMNDKSIAASESIANFSIRSMMCVPLLGLNGDPVGAINIDTQNPLKQFRAEDLDLLMVVAGQAAISYETARLVTSFAEKQKQDSEMQIAARVQRALLPEKLPEVKDFQFFASYESAQAVGGDYYDCIVLADKRVALAFGDVAGKGVPASLVMSRMSAVVQNTMEFVHEVGQAAERINHHMCVNAVEGRFVTFTLSIIDLATYTMSLVIAGHMSPMIRKVDGSIEEFPEELVGLPIGVVDGMPYESVTRVLAPGEMVVIYTDGVSEAMNSKADLYGVERLRDLISAGPPDAHELGSLILADVKKHANGHPQNDDITLMCFGRMP